ncbi:1,2-dihydroxy-3-keto-5-methylthiopentene dioxygenase [Rhodotorula kratochvilovae]
MLPWNPPSAFSLTGDQQRYGYSDASGSQGGPPNHQQPSPQQQSPTGQQQQQQSPQQQQGPPGAIPPPPTTQSAYPPMTLAATLHFLQSEHRRYARDRNEWEIERAEMRARIALLEGEKRGNEAALKSLGRRCKMLEMALRGERSKFLSTTNALGGTPSVSGTSSPIPGATPALAKEPLAGAIPPHKLAALQKDAPAPDAKSAPMAASASTPAPNAAASSVPAHARGDSLAVPAATPNGFSTGSWGGASAGGTAAAAARDPRGKARSREYLKQCLQEITYLTSSATLNPLAAHSYAAPSVPRPRKVLPEQVPAASAPGVISLAPAHTPAAAAASTAAAEPAPEAAKDAPAPPAPPAPAPAEQQAHPDLLTSFPSDPPSAFVPLRRQISHPGQGQPGSGAAGTGTRKQRADAALDAEIARMAAAGEEGKADEAAAALVQETGAARADERAEEVRGEERAAAGDAAPALEPAAEDAALTDEADASPPASGADDAPPKLSAAELALQAPHAAPEANEEKPDDAVAEIATAGEEGEEEEVTPATEEQEEKVEEEKVDASTDGEKKDEEGEIDENESSLSPGLAAVLSSAGVSDAPEEDAPTAIFGGGASGDEWRATLQEAGRRAYSGGFAGAAAATGGDRELQAMEWDLEEATAEEEEGEGEGLGGKKRKGKGKKRREEETVGLDDAERFKPARVLRSHLDAVRVVACVEVARQELVVTAGDDYVVKIWRDAFGKTSSRSDLEPVATLRGHTGPVTALAVSRPSATDEPVLFSASLDSTICIWSFPSADHETYDPADTSFALGVVEPGADAVWGLAALSHDRVACITADGSIQVWNWREARRLASWTYGPADAKGSLRKRPTQAPTPTALAAMKSASEDGPEGERLVVAFQSAVVKIFDAEDGREVQRIDADETADGTPETQINALSVREDLKLLATAHEDRYIRVFDLTSGKCIVSHLAHLDGVTGLAFSPAASPSESDVLLASSSHDTSLRLWTVHTEADKSSLTCVQEASSHRVKGAEGVLGVAFKGDGAGLVTAGADGTARVWEQ